MALESAAVFQQWMSKLGLEDLYPKFVELGWKNAGEFAFASSYVPGQQGQERFEEEVIQKLLTAENMNKKAAVRRLFFECYTLVVSEMKRRSERTEDEAPRKMPMPERAERHRQQAGRLSGLKLEGEMEPAHSLVDKAVAIFDEEIINYIPWQDCISREMEMAKVKTLKELAGSGNAAAFELKLGNALKRRGLAFEQANVMSYESHELLVTMLVQTFVMEVPDGLIRPTVDRLRQADQKVFSILQSKCRDGLRAKGAGGRPIDNLMERVLDSAAIQMLVMPIAVRGGGGGSRAEADDGDKRSKAQKRKNRAAEEEGRKRAKEDTLGKKGAGKKGGGVPVPVELRGLSSQTKDGRNLCFGYNAKAGCQHGGGVKKGGRCKRGYHLCMVPGCEGEHPAFEHH